MIGLQCTAISNFDITFVTLFVFVIPFHMDIHYNTNSSTLGNSVNSRPSMRILALLFIAATASGKFPKEVPDKVIVKATTLHNKIAT